MKLLPEGCRISNFVVIPANWRSAAAPVAKPWCCRYRFYDSHGQVKEVMIKEGVNRLKTAKERREVMAALIAQEMAMLEGGYNPITKRYSQAREDYGTWEEAVTHAASKLTLEPTTRRDLDSRIKQVIKAARRLNYSKWPVCELRLKHVMEILEKAGPTPYSFNKCRAYLSIVYKRLRQIEAIDSNFIRDIDKKKTVKKIRKTLTRAERIEVDRYLKQVHYPFWRFMHIYFQGYAREIELLAVKYEGVDLAEQRFKVLDKKGRRGPMEKWKTINERALPLWQEVMKDCKPGQFVFSYGFVPGDIPYKSSAVTHTWWRLVKKRMGIMADFGSLRHTAITKESGKQGANVIELTGHTSRKMIDEVYDVEKEGRDHAYRKMSGNDFTG